MRRTSFVVVLVAMVVVASGAGCRPSGSGSGAGADASADGGGAGVGVADAGGGASAPVTSAEASALVDAWLSAQNAGDFKAYEALYAGRFEGVRRSGVHVARLDRARWMKERARMFGKPTKVVAKDRVITTSHEGAEVRFLQSWSQEGYSDEGEKRMVLVRDHGKLAISREEMLRSQVAAGIALPVERFALVVKAPDVRIVLSDDAREVWTTGATSVVSMGDPVTTRRAVDVAKLPPGLAGWIGQRVEMFGTTARVCEATVTGLSVIGRVTPHFGTTGRWTGTGDSEGQPKPKASEIAEEAWALTASAGSGKSGRLLVAEVRAEGAGQCARALWARRASEPAPVLVEMRAADRKLQAEVMAELRKTKAWAETQKSYEEQREPKDQPRWDEYDARVDARTFEHPSGTTLVTLSITSGTGCGSFGGTLSGVWKREGGGLKAVSEPKGEELKPVSAGDVDGDGVVELMFGEGAMRARGGGRYEVEKLVVPFLDCGC